MDSSVLWIFWLLILGVLFLIPGYLACRANRSLLHVRKNVIYQPDEKSFWVGLGCFSYLIFGMGLVFMSLVLIIVVLKILVILGMLG